MSETTKSPDKKRKAAPPVSQSTMADAPEVRVGILAELDKKYPDRKHSYASPDVLSDQGAIWAMKAKGQEVAKDDNGNVIHHITDPVVYVPKEQFDAERRSEAKFALEQAKTVDDRTNLSRKRNPKTPIDQEE